MLLLMLPRYGDMKCMALPLGECIMPSLPCVDSRMDSRQQPRHGAHSTAVSWLPRRTNPAPPAGGSCTPQPASKKGASGCAHAKAE